MGKSKKIEQAVSDIETKFLNPGFEYWFTDHEHIRSPFPKEIMPEVKRNTTNIFLQWIKSLKESELNNIPAHEFAEMFETVLFNEALKLVNDDDQRLTITYPFMPRVGDLVDHKENGHGKVIERKIFFTHENKKMFELTVSSFDGSKEWKTQFELKEYQSE